MSYRAITLAAVSPVWTPADSNVIIAAVDTWKAADRIVRALSDMALTRVIVFGSAVHGTVGDERDMDIAVVLDAQNDSFDRLGTKLEIRRRIRPINAEIAIDLLVYTESEFQRLSRSASFLRREVLDRGRVVYERAGSAVAGAG